MTGEGRSGAAVNREVWLRIASTAEDDAAGDGQGLPGAHAAVVLQGLDDLLGHREQAALRSWLLDRLEEQRRSVGFADQARR